MKTVSVISVNFRDREYLNAIAAVESLLLEWGFDLKLKLPADAIACALDEVVPVSIAPHSKRLLLLRLEEHFFKIFDDSDQISNKNL